ncbi:MAG: L-threonylcarbamoyladenylate synthase [Thermomicrobiales bacterium]
MARATAALRAGFVVAIPTDTVYGLAAAIDQRAAIDRLYALKARPANKAIPVLLSSSKELRQVSLGLSQVAEALADRFWPGALTLVVAARSHLASGLTSVDADGTSTVAVRVPDHQLARAIIRAAGGALAVTSANRSGGAPALDVGDVLGLADAAPTVIVDGGPAPGTRPSTVVLALSSQVVILREGAIAGEEIAAVVLGAGGEASGYGPVSAQGV